MHHADAPAVNVKRLNLFRARVGHRIVVASGADHRRELFKPVQHHRRGEVSSVKNQVHIREKVGRLRPQFVQFAYCAREMSISEEANSHKENITSWVVIVNAAHSHIRLFALTTTIPYATVAADFHSILHKG